MGGESCSPGNLLSLVNSAKHLFVSGRYSVTGCVWFSLQESFIYIFHAYMLRRFLRSICFCHSCIRVLFVGVEFINFLSRIASMEILKIVWRFYISSPCRVVLYIRPCKNAASRRIHLLTDWLAICCFVFFLPGQIFVVGAWGLVCGSTWGGADGQYWRKLLNAPTLHHGQS